MALFESYERREKQILAVLKEYGDIIKMWHEIFLHLLKAAIKCDRDGVQRLKKQAEELIERERKCAKFITKEDGTEKKR